MTRLACTCISLALGACSGGDVEPEPPVMDGLVGTWTGACDLSEEVVGERVVLTATLTADALDVDNVGWSYDVDYRFDFGAEGVVEVRGDAFRPNEGDGTALSFSAVDIGAYDTVWGFGAVADLDGDALAGDCAMGAGHVEIGGQTTFGAFDLVRADQADTGEGA